MKESSLELQEQGIQARSSDRDLLPVETHYQRRTDAGSGAASGDTSVAAPERLSRPGEGPADSLWTEIFAAASRPDFQKTEFVRLILREMSLACHELRLATGHSSLAFKVKPLTAEIHALRILAETARSVTQLSVQADILDLDGPKFNYVFGRLVKTFHDSMVEAGCNQLIRDTVMGFLRNNLAKIEEEVRRQVENARTLVGTKEVIGWPKAAPNPSASNPPDQK